MAKMGEIMAQIRCEPLRPYPVAVVKMARSWSSCRLRPRWDVVGGDLMGNRDLGAHFRRRGATGILP